MHTNTPQKTPHSFRVSPHEEGLRLDHFITQQLPSYSRSFFKNILEKQCILINGIPASKAGIWLKKDDEIVVNFPLFNPEIRAMDELSVSIIAEHEDFIIINKPAGLIVHKPTKLSQEVTLVDWLVSRYANLKSIGLEERPGIVHRLDKDTSGVMIVPLNNQAHACLSDMFKNRTIKKTYLAVVHGHPPSEGTIDLPIYRHPIHKHKMVAGGTQRLNVRTSRSAITNYRVLTYFKDTALVELHPITGRTHQIRVHCATQGHPIVGDAVYGKSSPDIGRQALHAHQLSFTYQGQQFTFTGNPPDDFNLLIQSQALR